MPTLQDVLGPKVWEVQELKRRPQREVARAMLERIAKQVQPIMRKRGWRVCKLSEFYPRSANLLGLNVNAGQEVKLRLRKPNNDKAFFPYEFCLGTMLHELVHNAIGPHNRQFYAMLDELRDECTLLMHKGITGTGQGFDGPSMGRLGGRGPGAVHDPPTHMARQAALAAAEKRARQQAVMMQGGGCKLGGSREALMRRLTPAAAAAAAAERRARDDRWCGGEGRAADDDGSDGSDGTGHLATPAQAVPVARAPSSASARAAAAAEARAREEVGARSKRPLEVIVLDDQSDSGDGELTPVHKRRRPPEVVDLGSPASAGLHPWMLNRRGGASGKAEEWTCSVCTLINKQDTPVCTLCMSKREGAWECRTCSLCNLEWEVECAVCGTAAPRGEHVV